MKGHILRVKGEKRKCSFFLQAYVRKYLIWKGSG